MVIERSRKIKRMSIGFNDKRGLLVIFVFDPCPSRNSYIGFLLNSTLSGSQAKENSNTESVFKDPLVLPSQNLQQQPISGQGFGKITRQPSSNKLFNHQVHSHMKVYTYCTTLTTLNACNQLLIMAAKGIQR